MVKKHLRYLLKTIFPGALHPHFFLFYLFDNIKNKNVEEIILDEWQVK